MRRVPVVAALALSLGLALLPACSSDPVHSHLIDSLGGEQPGVKEGPLHRPGQPCVACHGENGPADTEFSLAGTVYEDQMTTPPKPLPDARIHFIDANGKTYDAAANCAGNFFVMKNDYSPAWPVWTSIFYGSVGGAPFEVPMDSPIYREGSCAMCHVDPQGPKSVTRVYLAPAPLPGKPPSSCP